MKKKIPSKRAFVKAVLLAVIILFPLLSCEKVSDKAVEINVDFTWQGMQSCDWGNPEISLKGVPENTKTIKLSMYDHVYRYDHGSVKFPYRGENLIEKHRYKIIQGPCAYSTPGKYEITIKALDKDDIVIGFGSNFRYYPEDNQ